MVFASHTPLGGSEQAKREGRLADTMKGVILISWALEAWQCPLRQRNNDSIHSYFYFNGL